MEHISPSSAGFLTLRNKTKANDKNKQGIFFTLTLVGWIHILLEKNNSLEAGFQNKPQEWNFTVAPNSTKIFFSIKAI
jgi:hypothetical protein